MVRVWIESGARHAENVYALLPVVRPATHVNLCKCSRTLGLRRLARVLIHTLIENDKCPLINYLQDFMIAVVHTGMQRELKRFREGKESL